MATNMVVRRKGDYQDTRLIPLRKEGIALLKKHARHRTNLAFTTLVHTQDRSLSILTWQPMS